MTTRIVLIVVVVVVAGCSEPRPRLHIVGDSFAGHIPADLLAETYDVSIDQRNGRVTCGTMAGDLQTLLQNLDCIPAEDVDEVWVFGGYWDVQFTQADEAKRSNLLAEISQKLRERNPDLVVRTLDTWHISRVGLAVGVNTDEVGHFSRWGYAWFLEPWLRG